MQADVLIHSAAQLLTISGGPQRGNDLGDLGIIEDGALALTGDTILAVGETSSIVDEFQADISIDASGKVLMPGFVDPHTHLIWAGNRAGEFEMRLGGASYMEIMAAGGGIMSTVRQTRAASIDDLIEQSRRRLLRMRAYGTTSVEVKTGYGLNLETETKILEATLELEKEGILDLAATFLGAHAVPEEYKGRTQDYTDLVCSMLPEVRQWWRNEQGDRRLPFVDVFCEEGAFDLKQSEQILTTARRLGFPLKIHADEFKGLGGTALAARLGAASADHLVRTPVDDIKALAQSDTVAVGLPGTPFGLGESDYTPAGEILNAGGILALATDLNPGTAWCESMQFVIALACRYMRLTPAKAIAAATINAAAAINRSHIVGSLEQGKQADMILLEVSDYRNLGYRFGTNLVDTVITRGQITKIKE